MQKRFELVFEWRGFELHPEIPAGGHELSDMFGQAQLDGMLARLQEVADGLGVTFSPPTRAPSTKKALALSAWARSEGKLDAFRDAAMDAHWRDGRDIEADAVLTDLLTQSDLDPSRGLAFLGDAQVPDILLAQRREAMEWGVTGIPTWFMLPPESAMSEDPAAEGPRPVKVVGCQPLEVVENAARMAGAKLR